MPAFEMFPSCCSSKQQILQKELVLKHCGIVQTMQLAALQTRWTIIPSRSITAMTWLTFLQLSSWRRWSPTRSCTCFTRQMQFLPLLHMSTLWLKLMENQWLTHVVSKMASAASLVCNLSRKRQARGDRKRWFQWCGHWPLHLSCHNLQTSAPLFQALPNPIRCHIFCFFYTADASELNASIRYNGVDHRRGLISITSVQFFFDPFDHFARLGSKSRRKVLCIDCHFRVIGGNLLQTC